MDLVHGQNVYLLFRLILIPSNVALKLVNIVKILQWIDYWKWTNKFDTAYVENLFKSFDKFLWYKLFPLHFRAKCGKFSPEDFLLVKTCAFWLEGVVMVRFSILRLLKVIFQLLPFINNEYYEVNTCTWVHGKITTLILIF